MLLLFVLLWLFLLLLLILLVKVDVFLGDDNLSLLNTLFILLLDLGVYYNLLVFGDFLLF